MLYLNTLSKIKTGGPKHLTLTNVVFELVSDYVFGWYAVHLTLTNVVFESI